MLEATCLQLAGEHRQNGGRTELISLTSFVHAEIKPFSDIQSQHYTRTE